MGKKIGIDLGTTYSVVSYVDDTGIIVNVESSEGDKTTPSVVFFDPNGTDVVVGSGARDAGSMNPECLVERVKNYMGDPNYRIERNGTEFSASAVSAIILKKLITDAETWLGGEDIDGAIITCPAYFGDAAKNATREAGENVTLKNGQKLKVLRIIDEPTAAAVAYGNSCNEDMHKTVLIYDLGGGTFDCTIMKLDFEGSDKKYQVITTGGNHQLGGKDWDDALASYVRDEFCAATGCDAEAMKDDPECAAWFSEKIEKAKIALTQKQSTSLTPSFEGSKAKVEITREKFDEITRGLFDQTIYLVDQMLNDKGMNIVTDIDEIILVGGSTRMLQIEEGLQLHYNKPISKFDPDKAVSNGAALVASGASLEENLDMPPVMPAGGDAFGGFDSPSLGGGSTFEDKSGNTNQIVEVCTKSYCLRYYNGGKETFINLVKKDEPKPAIGTTKTIIPGLVLGGGDSNGMTNEVALLIMENDSRDDHVERENCVELYEEVPIMLAEPVSASSQVEIQLYVNISGELKLTLIETATGRQYEMIPVRKGGDTNSIGMDAATGFTLVG
ncbi:MAG: Hsp70 family protein [Clostridia bacterium]|nr:Hsp70 family protein [Clostridia bacterium]